MSSRSASKVSVKSCNEVEPWLCGQVDVRTDDETFKWEACDIVFDPAIGLAGLVPLAGRRKAALGATPAAAQTGPEGGHVWVA